MKNVTEEIKNAIKQNELWAISIFFDILEKLENRKIAVSYWDGEENWAIIISDKKPVGYLWKRYPVLFYPKGISQSSKDCNIYVSIFEFDCCRRFK
jgi:hypothetical protein